MNVNVYCRGRSSAFFDAAKGQGAQGKVCTLQGISSPQLHVVAQVGTTRSRSFMDGLKVYNWFDLSVVKLYLTRQ